MADREASIILSTETWVSKILVVCGGPRNGSTSLLEGLELSGAVLNCGEIFNPLGVQHGQDSYRLRLKPELNYFAFLRERKAIPLPTVVEQKRRFQTYLKQLESAAHTRWIGLNIKFNGWHNLDDVTQEIARPPRAIRLLDSKDTVFLLVRRDVVAQALSEYLAQESGAWHFTTGQARSEFKRKVHVNVRKLISRARLLNRQTAMLQRWLTPHRLVTMAYEEMFKGDTFSQSAVQVLGTQLGVPQPSLTQPLPLERVSPMHYNWIENRAELQDALAANGLTYDDAIAQALSTT